MVSPVNCPTYPTATETTGNRPGLYLIIFLKKIIPNIYIIIQMLARSPGKSGKGGGGGLPSVAHDIEFGGLSL